MTTPQEEQARRNEAVLRALGAHQPPQWNTAPTRPDQGEGLWVPPSAAPGPVEGQPIEEGRPGWPLAAWVVGDAALGLVLAVILQFIALFVFIQIRGETLMGGLEALQNDPTFTLVAAPTLGLGFAAMAALRIRLLRRLPWSWFGLHGRRLLPAIGWGALAGVAFLIVNASLSLLFQLIGSVPDQSEQILGPFRSASPLQLALLGLFIVLIGPFLEELFFRGYAQRAFRQRLGPTWGIVLSAALFAAPHAFGISTGFIGLLVPIFCGGVILAVVYQRTGNLWSAVVAHCMNNLVGFIGLLVSLQIQ